MDFGQFRTLVNKSLTEVSAGRKLVSTGHSCNWSTQMSGHERLPLGNGSRAAKREGLAVDEVALGVEVIMPAGAN